MYLYERLGEFTRHRRARHALRRKSRPFARSNAVFFVVRQKKHVLPREPVKTFFYVVDGGGNATSSVSQRACYGAVIYAQRGVFTDRAYVRHCFAYVRRQRFAYVRRLARRLYFRLFSIVHASSYALSLSRSETARKEE